MASLAVNPNGPLFALSSPFFEEKVRASSSFDKAHKVLPFFFCSCYICQASKGTENITGKLSTGNYYSFFPFERK